MIKHLALTLSLALAMLAIQAQTVSVKWSEKQEYNKTNGYYNYFMGGNSKYIYVRYGNSPLNYSRKDTKVKVIAYDKTSMKVISAVAMNGFKENQATKNQMKGLVFFSFLIFENSVNLFWTKYEDGKTQLYAQVFDAKLKNTFKLKKIYEVKTSGKKSKPTLFVIGNKEAGEKIIIGAELPREKNENVRFEYKVLKNDLSYDASNQITLPYATPATTKALSASYEIGENGFLYAKNYLKMDKEDKKNLKKNESAYYNLLTIINPATGKFTSHALKYENKNLFRVSYIIANGKTKIYGMYSDLLVDKKGNDLHGIFYAEIEDGEPIISTPKFIDFDKATLTKLFAKDNEDKKKSGLFASKNAKESNEESINNDYVIEKVLSIDKDNVVLFATRMINYSTTTCNSKGQCTTRYYCTKSNVTTFKIDNMGKLIWASNLDRQMTYSGWDIYDLNIMYENDNMFVSYGSVFNSIENGSNTSKKRKGHLNSEFEYAVFNYGTGAYKKNNYKVNKEGVKKVDKKTITAREISTIENKMYVNSYAFKVKPWAWTLCAIGCFTLPLSPAGRNYWGSIGTIQPVK